MSDRLCHKTNFEPFLFRFGGKEPGRHVPNFFPLIIATMGGQKKKNQQLTNKKRRHITRQVAM